MCHAENCYYPACGCWVGHEVVSPCIRRHGGTGGVCRELVVEGVLRKPDLCLPCQRKQRPQLSDVGRNLSSFMDEIHESNRGGDTEPSSERRASLGSCSTNSTAETLVNPEDSRQHEDWERYAIRVRQSLETEDSLILDANNEQDGRVTDELYHPEQSWYHVAAAPTSPLESETEAWEMELDCLLAAEETERVGHAAPAARFEVRREKNRCCGCIPS